MREQIGLGKISQKNNVLRGDLKYDQGLAEKEECSRK